MYLMNSTDSLKINKVFLPLYDSDGKEVQVNLYTETVGQVFEGIVKAPFEFESNDSFELADNILIGYDNTTFYPNVITNVGDNVYRVAKKIEQGINEDINIKQNFSIFNTIALPEGLYYFANNEALIISKVFSNLRISFTELNARFDELAKNIDLEAKNDEAIKSVIADFSYKPDFFRYLDLNQIRELVILKMLLWLTFGTDNYEDSSNNYNNYKKDMINVIKIQVEGNIENPEVIDEGVTYEWKWKPRA